MSARMAKRFRKAVSREYMMYMEFLRKWPWWNRIGFAYNLAFYRWYEKVVLPAILVAMIAYIVLNEV